PRDLLVADADRLRDQHVLAPLVAGAAQPADPQDHELALARGQRRLAEHVVAEYEPALHQARVVGERAEDVEHSPAGRSSLADAVEHVGAELVVGERCHAGLAESHWLSSRRSWYSWRPWPHRSPGSACSKSPTGSPRPRPPRCSPTSART